MNEEKKVYTVEEVRQPWLESVEGVSGGEGRHVAFDSSWSEGNRSTSSVGSVA